MWQKQVKVLGIFICNVRSSQKIQNTFSYTKSTMGSFDVGLLCGLLFKWPVAISYFTLEKHLKSDLIEVNHCTQSNVSEHFAGSSVGVLFSRPDYHSVAPAFCFHQCLLFSSVHFSPLQTSFLSRPG